MRPDNAEMIDWLADYIRHGKWFRIATEGTGPQERVTTDCLALRSPDGGGYMGCLMFATSIKCEECPVGELAERAGLEPPEVEP